MTPDGAMVLTGKMALDYSGSVSAEDNIGIGGYEHIMGPNGQAQYWAPDLSGAVDVLLAHYAHTYVAPGERFPRPAPTTDPVDRDVCRSPHAPVDGSDFSTVGDIFSADRNAERNGERPPSYNMGACCDIHIRPGRAVGLTGRVKKMYTIHNSYRNNQE